MIKPREVYELAQVQQFKCALTGMDLTPETAVLDHITPRSQGGTDERDNLQVIHVTVNRIKHTLGNDEFLDWCRRVVSHLSRQHAEWQ